MKSDVMYEPFSHKDRNLPPILVGVQRTVDLKFYRRVNQYCLQMFTQSSILPIVITISINNTTQDGLDMIVKEDPDVHFAARLPSPGWAKSFYLINAGTIRAHLNTRPLEPIIAMSHFFIKQKTSLISMELRNDATIQLLLKYAKDIFNDDIGKYDNIVDALNTTCSQSLQQLLKAKETLDEDIKNTSSRKRTAQALDDGILFVNEMCKKHCLLLESSASSAPSSPSSSSSSTASSTTSSTDFDSPPMIQHTSSNWAFIDLWRNSAGDRMDWGLCFDIGKGIGLFEQYKSKNSVKAAYFRSKAHAN